MNEYATQKDLAAIPELLAQIKAEREARESETHDGDAWKKYLSGETKTDLQLAHQALMRNGMTERMATDRLLKDPDLAQTDPNIAAQIESARRAEENLARMRQEEAEANSVEGRKARAAVIEAERAERDELLRIAEVLLREAGNFDPADSEDDRLRAAGLLEPTQDEKDAVSLEANLSKMDEDPSPTNATEAAARSATRPAINKRKES